MGLYMENGTPIKNPMAYVARIEENGYTKPLFNDRGEEIRDPVAYVMKGMDKRGRGSSAATGTLNLFMENGTPIKNPAAYIAKIEQNGYSKPLFNEKGQEIKDPVAYLNSAEKRAAQSS